MKVALLGLDHAAITLSQGSHAGKTVALTEALAGLAPAGDAKNGAACVQSYGRSQFFIQGRGIRLQKIKNWFIFTKLCFHLA
jgi:hypothetical protein